MRPLLWVLVAVVMVTTLGLFLSQLRDTVLLSSPDVQQAEVRAKVAEADHQAAELQRDTARIHQEQAAEAGWQPVTVGVQHLALLALLLAVPLLVAAALLAGGGLMLRRHLSLPTKDGRVPLVGLDRELSAEALFRYQALQGRGASFEALPVGRSRRGLESLLEPERAPAIESGGETE